MLFGQTASQFSITSQGSKGPSLITAYYDTHYMGSVMKSSNSAEKKMKWLKYQIAFEMKLNK